MYDVTIIDIINCIFSFIMMIAAAIGIRGLYNLKKQQQEACYGFYINFAIYLQELNGLITKGGKIPGWIKLLGKSAAERSDENYKTDKNDLLYAADFSEKMLEFLRNSTNQVPPKKDAIENWKYNFEIIKKFLFQIKFCIHLNSSSSNWTEEKCKKNYQILKKAINELMADLNEKMKISATDNFEN